MASFRMVHNIPCLSPNILFLPKYGSEINPIKWERQHIKKDELAGQMLEETAQQVKFNCDRDT